MPLFTPEGERRCAGASWNPVYPFPARPPTGPRRAPSSRPKATAPRPGRDRPAIRYARVVPGRIAGTISVICTPSATADECTVTVTYDVTSLDTEGPGFVTHLESVYDAFLDEWRKEILATL
jgi:hypothetical protein